MIQDIFPSKLDNSFSAFTPVSGDKVFCFDSEGRLLADTADGSVRVPVCGSFPDAAKVYLFSVDSERYFLTLDETDAVREGFGRFTIRELRDCCCGKSLYAAFTAYHLWKWYTDNKFCGRCGCKLSLHGSERALLCPECGNVIYPRINPAVIVGVISGEKLLITRYRRGFAHNALVAGFTEIGETLEQTVSREVMEETGVKIKNIRYYKSQPWGMAQDMLVGFFCDADSTEIHMDKNELKYAEWVDRADIVLQPYDLSLTNEMMKMFKEGCSV